VVYVFPPNPTAALRLRTGRATLRAVVDAAASSAARALRFAFGAFVLASTALVLAAIMATLLILLLAQNVRPSSQRASRLPNPPTSLSS
jgi:hypothetical protein